MLALTRVQVQKPALLRQMVDAAGSARELFDNLPYINDILPGIPQSLVAALSDKSIMERAEREMEFVQAKGIKLTCLNDSDYPYRLFECADAPLTLYSLGDVPYNAKRIVSIVGTRHATEYGKEHKVDYFVFGHLHYAADIESSERILFLGDWLNQPSYIALDNNGKIELKINN